MAQGRQRADRERARLEGGAELLLQSAGPARLDLVLDGDVRPPTCLVLRHEQAVKGVGEGLADVLKRLALDAEGRPLPQIHDAGDHGRRRRGGGRFGEAGGQLRLEAGRKLVEEGQVRGHLIALRREMGAAQMLEPAIIARAERGGDDERRAQISTWLPSSTTRLGGRLKNSIALSAFRSIQAKSFSRQTAMPGLGLVIRVWRARKKLVSIIRIWGPQLSTRPRAAGTFVSCMKP